MAARSFRDVGCEWIGRNRGRRGDSGAVAAGDVELLANRRDGCGGYALGECLVVDEGDIEDAHAVFAAGGVEEFAAVLYLENFGLAEGVQNLLADVFAGMFFGVFQKPAVVDEFFELFRIGQLV